MDATAAEAPFRNGEEIIYNPIASRRTLLRNWHIAASVICEAALSLPGRDCFGGSTSPRNDSFLQKDVRGALWSYSQ